MSVEVDDPIWYYEWTPAIAEHDIYSGIIRVIPGGEEHPHAKKHLRIDDPEEPSGFRNINNIVNDESTLDHAGSNYWRQATAK